MDWTECATRGKPKNDELFNKTLRKSSWTSCSLIVSGLLGDPNEALVSGLPGDPKEVLSSESLVGEFGLDDLGQFEIKFRSTAMINVARVKWTHSDLKRTSFSNGIKKAFVNADGKWRSSFLRSDDIWELLLFQPQTDLITYSWIWNDCRWITVTKICAAICRFSSEEADYSKYNWCK